MSIAFGSRACPKFFQAWCRDAARPGSPGYVWVGRQLAGHLVQLSPLEVEDAEWHEEMVRFEQIILERNDNAVLRWFDDHLPRCMELIPNARRASFLQGFYLALNEDEVDITSD